MSTNLIGTRLKGLREQRGLSQEQLAQVFGFKDRQTVSAIETGERRLSADELLLAVEKLGAPLEYFTDPFVLAGEGQFSWRHTNVGRERLSAYERVAGRWIATYRKLAPDVGYDLPLLRRSLGLTKQHSYENAMSAGERFTVEFDLGDIPALHLAETMERRLGILVLMVDALEGISGAACRLPELDAVLVNRREAPGRRHFDLAHELFHILTWETMPPQHAEEATEFGGDRVEQLANNFASALLMPARIVQAMADWSALKGGGLVAQLKAAAERLQVTASALKWRLVALGDIALAVAREIADGTLRLPGGDVPPLFSKMFLDVLARALDLGRISVRRAAGLLDVKLDELANLFEAHGIPSPVEL